MKLTEQQSQAVLYTDSPALVVAGAGSGKTKTLTEKIAYLVASGVEPGRILAITFTNKAADEMKSRLYHLTGLGPQSFPWVRTYHSACLMILRKHGRLLGYASPLQVLSVYHQEKLAAEILLAHNIEKKFSNQIVFLMSKAKNTGTPETYLDGVKSFKGIRITDIYKFYEKRLFEMNAVDFDNILLKTRDILRDHEPVRTSYQAFFSYILVDEYQDTNDLQEDITGLLLGPKNSLFCVGDDWQAVYGFRGSNVKHFLRFKEKYKNAKIFTLEENFRSADEIVKAANDLIDHNPDKMNKTCFSKKSGGIVEVHDFFSDMEEAQWVAGKAGELERDAGIGLEKMAVVYRTKFCSLPFERTFRQYGIPYRMMGSQGFFERMEILDINAYLSAAFFPDDDVSFKRILNTPRRGIGPSMTKKIEACRTDGMSLREAARHCVKEKALSGKVLGEITFLLELLTSTAELPPLAAVDQIIEQTGYASYLKKTAKTEEEYISRMENIEQLRYTAGEKTDLLSYLEEASLIREDKDRDAEGRKSGVSLITIHSAKGLEYEVVFIVGCEENLFPHWRSLQEGREALQEERRLMYVAMTRAERLLYVTHTSYRKGNFAYKSRFADQIEDCLR